MHLNKVVRESTLVKCELSEIAITEIMIAIVGRPGPVTNLQVSVISENQLFASWTGVAGATMYIVQASNYSGDIAATTSEDYPFTVGAYSQVLSGNIGVCCCT